MRNTTSTVQDTITRVTDARIFDTFNQLLRFLFATECTELQNHPICVSELARLISIPTSKLTRTTRSSCTLAISPEILEMKFKAFQSHIVFFPLPICPAPSSKN